MLHETMTIFHNEIHQIDQDLFYLKYLVEDAVNSGKSPITLKGAFLNFGKAKNKYDQVRYLNKLGMEVIRINNIKGYAQAVDECDLQNKFKRYYFSDTFSQKNNSVFVSPLDLNIENNEIEIPHKPMIRIGTPVFNNKGEKIGVVLLNYYGSRISELLKEHYGKFYMNEHGLNVLNRDGYWLISDNYQKDFGFMLPHGRSFSKENPQAWEAVNSSEAGQYEKDGTVYLFHTFYFLTAKQMSSSGSPAPYQPSAADLNNSEQYWKLVNVIDSSTFDEIRSNIIMSKFRQIAVLTMLAFMLSVIIAYLIKQNKEYLQKLRDKTAEAEQASQFKSNFLANMSHEIRTPMNGIIGLCYLMQKNNKDPKLKDYLIKMDRSANLLLGIINDILDFSKIEAGMLKVENIKFDLEEVLENVAGLISLKTEEKNLELVFNTSPDVPRYLVGDPLRLGQILINICNNAVKFTSVGEIVLSVDVLEKTDTNIHIKISVKDTGIGMSQEQMKKIFVAFDQADSSVTRKFGGTGLGLTICKNLSELMGGTIGVESEPGKGSTFWFTVVLQLPQKEEKTSLLVSGSFSGKNALVVDDNPVARDVFHSYLEVIGFEAAQASNGLEALEIIVGSDEDKMPELVLVDWNMPVMDGLNFIKTIQNNPVIVKKPKIILTTAYGREDLANELSNTPIDGFLIKPITLSSLFDTILDIYSMNTDIASEPKKQSGYEDYTALWGAKLLLAEDSEINQQIAVELLSDQKIDVDVVNNGMDALLKVQTRHYDGVLMDVQMPGMDGYESTKKIRQLGGIYSEIPIIAMTANTMSGDRELALDAGMNDHISKPINVDEMYRTLARYIVPANPVTRGEPEKQKEKPAPENIPDKLDGLDLVGGIARLKGVAANIGAAELSAAAKIIEESCLTRDKANDDDIRSMENELKTVLLSISSLPIDDSPEGSAENTPGTDSGMFDELVQMVAQNDADALELAEELAKRASEKDKQILRKAQQYLDVFDFKNALETLTDNKLGDK
ncbi:MAG: response regulator [Deferribacterales bacterium]